MISCDKYPAIMLRSTRWGNYWGITLYSGIEPSTSQLELKCDPTGSAVRSHPRYD
jgi:hypothetical protein